MIGVNIHFWACIRIAFRGLYHSVATRGRQPTTVWKIKYKKSKCRTLGRYGNKPSYRLTTLLAFTFYKFATSLLLSQVIPRSGNLRQALLRQKLITLLTKRIPSRDYIIPSCRQIVVHIINRRTNNRTNLTTLCTIPLTIQHLNH